MNTTNVKLAQEAWKLHLDGELSSKIATKLKIQQRQVQILLKHCREKYPPETEQNAIRKIVKRMLKTNSSLVVITRHIKSVFPRVKIPADVAALLDKPKKVTKKTYRKKPTAAEGRKSLPKPKQTCTAIAVVNTKDKKTFQKEVKALKQRTESESKGRRKVITFKEFLTDALRSRPNLVEYCQKRSITVEQLANQMTFNGIMSDIIDEGLTKGTISGIQFLK